MEKNKVKGKLIPEKFWVNKHSRRDHPCSFCLLGMAKWPGCSRPHLGTLVALWLCHLRPWLVCQPSSWDTCHHLHTGTLPCRWYKDKMQKRTLAVPYKMESVSVREWLPHCFNPDLPIPGAPWILTCCSREPRQPLCHEAEQLLRGTLRIIVPWKSQQSGALNSVGLRSHWPVGGAT